MSHSKLRFRFRSLLAGLALQLLAWAAPFQGLVASETTKGAGEARGAAPASEPAKPAVPAAERPAAELQQDKKAAAPAPPAPAARADAAGGKPAPAASAPAAGAAEPGAPPAPAAPPARKRFTIGEGEYPLRALLAFFSEYTGHPLLLNSQDPAFLDRRVIVIATIRDAGEEMLLALFESHRVRVYSEQLRDGRRVLKAEPMERQNSPWEDPKPTPIVVVRKR